MPVENKERLIRHPRRKATFYESTLSMIAKRLNKKYPDDDFFIAAETWSREGFQVSPKIGAIKFRIYSRLLSDSVEETTLERACAAICEKKEAVEPRNVENFLKEEQKG